MALTKMVYSPYQEDIFKAIEQGSSNLAICAVAGSGKTTTIVSACRRLHENPRNVKFLAFNKLIADTLQQRLVGCADVSTLHSFGYSILKSIFNDPTRRIYIKVDKNKWRSYIDGHIYSLSNEITIDTPSNKVYGFKRNIEKLFNLARVNLIPSGNKGVLNDICDTYGIPTMFDEVSVVDELLETAYVMPSNLTIDFEEMIILPLSYKADIPTFKYVFIDECQDLNKAQRELMLACSKGGRFIAVGDKSQAINGFCGADCMSFERIASLPNTIELPLSVNYRCGTDILKLAQEIVPNIEAHNGAIKGNITHTKTLSTDLFQPNDMVLCRTSAPLVTLCMSLIERGIAAIVKGRDIAQGLKSLIEGSCASSIEGVLEYLQQERKQTLAALAKERKISEDDAKNTMRYQILDDKAKCVENICKHSVKTIYELNNYIDKLFSDDNIKNCVMLSTIHKAKGLEANRVLILLPSKLPLTWRGQAEWQLKQEQNLKYVALTRARKELVFIDMSEQELAKAEEMN